MAKKMVSMLVMLSVAGLASAAVIPPTHVGNNDPLVEDAARFVAAGATSGEVNGAYWKASTLWGAASRYIGATDAPAGGADRTLTAIGFVNEFMAQEGAEDHGMAIMFEPDPDQSAQLNFLDDFSGIWARGTGSAGPPVVPSSTYAVDTSVEHIYQIVYSGGTQKAYVDGNFAFDLFIGEWAGLDNFQGYFVGTVSSAAGSRSSWRLWQIEDGINIIPEPTTMAVLALGGLVSLLRKRR